MKLLITGGAGFIGSAVIRHIIQNTQDEVVNLDKLTYAGNLESLAQVSDSERYAFKQVDICDRAELDRVLSKHQPSLPTLITNYSNNRGSYHLPEKLSLLVILNALENKALKGHILNSYIMRISPSFVETLASSCALTKA